MDKYGWRVWIIKEDEKKRELEAAVALRHLPSSQCLI